MSSTLPPRKAMRSTRRPGGREDHHLANLVFLYILYVWIILMKSTLTTPARPEDYYVLSVSWKWPSRA